MVAITQPTNALSKRGLYLYSDLGGPRVSLID